MSQNNVATLVTHAIPLFSVVDLVDCVSALMADVCNISSKISLSRAIAQAVSRRLPTAAARVRTQLRSCGICCGQSGTGAGFLRVLRFPLPIRIPPVAPHSSSYHPGQQVSQLVAAVPSGLKSHPINNNNNNNNKKEPG
jgi:hypothetical protein